MPPNERDSAVKFHRLQGPQRAFHMQIAGHLPNLIEEAFERLDTGMAKAKPGLRNRLTFLGGGL